jgi:hypothetical protein
MTEIPLLPRDASVIELRQYTLHPGGFDVLVPLFEAELVHTQEEVGISVIGTFADLDDRNRFVWLRGFADLASRGRSLSAFYEGPVWAAHRNTVNPTMIDSDDVLLLPRQRWLRLRHRTAPRAPAPRFQSKPGRDRRHATRVGRGG